MQAVNFCLNLLHPVCAVHALKRHVGCCALTKHKISAAAAAAAAADGKAMVSTAVAALKSRHCLHAGFKATHRQAQPAGAKPDSL